MPNARAATPKTRSRDNERPLVEDIRLLGRLLGDVIREQEGQEIYELIEAIRRLSVSFRIDANDEADKQFFEIINADPNSAGAQFSRSMILLLNGDLNFPKY